MRDPGIGRLLFVLSQAPLVSQRLRGCGSLPWVLPRLLLPSPCASEFQRLPPMQGSGTPLGATLPGRPALPHPGSGLTVTPAWYIKPRFQASLSLSQQDGLKCFSLIMVASWPGTTFTPHPTPLPSTWPFSGPDLTAVLPYFQDCRGEVVSDTSELLPFSPLLA